MRYETLVRMSRAIGVHRDLKALFGILMDELHGVVQFDFIGVSLRDQDSDTFQNYFIDMASRSEFVPEEQLAPEEMLTLWVYERQEPLLRSTDEMEPRYSRLQAILKRLNICSTCALPLTTAHRKLGSSHSAARRSIPTRQTISGSCPKWRITLREPAIRAPGRHGRRMPGSLTPGRCRRSAAGSQPRARLEDWRRRGEGFGRRKAAALDRARSSAPAAIAGVRRSDLVA